MKHNNLASWLLFRRHVIQNVERMHVDQTVDVNTIHSDQAVLRQNMTFSTSKMYVYKINEVFQVTCLRGDV